MVFIDGTNIDPSGKLILEAVLVTLGIFNVSQRNQPLPWRLLGYLIDPNCEGIGNPEYKRKEQISKKMTTIII